MPRATLGMRDVRSVHFVGIGGAGMCGIAEILLAQGFTVTGSDLQDTPVTRRLAGLGARVCRGHSAAAVGEVDVVVVSSAIREDNPEVVAAHMAHIPVIARGEMLGELMRGRLGIAVAGSHGKTTTASLIASVLEAGGLEPTFIIGGQVTGAGTNGRLGAGRHMIAEADESDASFLLLRPVLAVITGIDRDHLDTYGQDFERLKAAFAEFAEQLPFYGCALISTDDPHGRELGQRISRPARSYGFGPDADYRATGVGIEAGRWTFDVTRPGRDALRVAVPLPGNHNVLNALAAIAVATEEGVSDEAIVAGLAECQGVERRFRVGRGAVDSKPVTVVDDYGHHPTEIAHIVDTVRRMWPGAALGDGLSAPSVHTDTRPARGVRGGPGARRRLAARRCLRGRRGGDHRGRQSRIGDRGRTPRRLGRPGGGDACRRLGAIARLGGGGRRAGDPGRRRCG